MINSIPLGTTHVSEFYGHTNYYKKVDVKHMNQVSEEWEIRVSWYYWDINKWVSVGSGFSSRRLKEIEIDK